MKILSWNINGIRAAIKKGLWEKLEVLDTDINCFQETKADTDIMQTALAKDPNCLYEHCFNSCKIKKGYSGVATYYKPKDKIKEDGDLFATEESKNLEKTRTYKFLEYEDDLGEEIFDSEGRYLTTFFELEKPEDLKKPETREKKLKIALINCYYPQGGRDFRIPYKLSFYAKILEKANDFKKQGYSIILTGDFNTTVADIDLARAKENRKTTGCLPNEREALNNFFNAGYIDIFRYSYPDKANVYTYWDQITRARERNVGWRIDYFLVDTDIIDRVKDIEVMTGVEGSDHCPVVLTLD